MFKELVESGQATTEDALYLLSSTKAELNHRSADERRALAMELQIGLFCP
jgi:hypothetical protein